MQQQADRPAVKPSLAWTAVIVCSLNYYMVTFQRMSPAVMAAELRAEFATTSAVLGLLSSIYFVVYAIMQIPVGYLVDRYNPGKVLGLFMGAAAVGSIMFGGAGSLGIAMFARGLTSFGLSAIFVTSTKLMGQIFDRKSFILAQGIIITSGNVGSMTAASPLAAIVDGIGWRSAFYMMGAITAVMALLIYLVLNRPEFKGIHKPANNAARKGISRFELIFSLVLGLAVFLKNGPLFSFQGLWGVPYLMSIHGLSKISASSIIMAMSFAAAVAGPLAGASCKISRLNERHFLNLNAVLFALSWIPIAFVMKSYTVQSLWIAGLLFGFSSTSVAIMMQILIRDIVNEGGRGVAIGISNSMSIMGGAVYQPLMGIFLDKAEADGSGLASGYSSALIFGMISAAISAVLFIFACHMVKGGKKSCDVGPMPEAAQ